MAADKDVLLQSCLKLSPSHLRDLQLQLVKNTEFKYLQEIYREIEVSLKFDLVARAPGDVSEKIFSYLDARSLCVAAQCSRRWREISNNNNLWLKLCQDRGYCEFADLPLPTREEEERQHSSPRHQTFKISSITPDFINPPLSKWKMVYIKGSVLESNWHHGNYSIAPLTKAHSNTITALCMEGDTVISGSRDGTASIWKLPELSLSHKLEGHTDEVTCLCVQEGVVISGCGDGVVRVYSVGGAQPIWSLKAAATGSVDALSFVNSTIVAAYSDCSLQCWEFLSGCPKQTHPLHGHIQPITCLEIHNVVIVSGSWDGSLRLWDGRTGLCLHVLLAHDEGVNCIVFNGNTLISGGGDTHIKLWSMSGDLLMTLYGHAQEILCLQCTVSYIVSSSADSCIRIWDHNNGSCVHVLEGHIGLVRCLALRGDTLISAGDRKKINIWNIKTGILHHTVHRQHTLVNKLLITDINIITTAPDNGYINVIKYW